MTKKTERNQPRTTRGPDQWPKKSWDHSHKGYHSNTLHRHAFKSFSARQVPLFKQPVQACLKMVGDHLDHPEEDSFPGSVAEKNQKVLFWDQNNLLVKTSHQEHHTHCVAWGNIMLWASFLHRGQDNSSHIKERMNGATFCEIWSKNLQPSVRALKMRHGFRLPAWQWSQTHCIYVTQELLWCQLKPSICKSMQYSI